MTATTISKARSHGWTTSDGRHIGRSISCNCTTLRIGRGSDAGYSGGWLHEWPLALCQGGRDGPYSGIRATRLRTQHSATMVVNTNGGTTKYEHFIVTMFRVVPHKGGSYHKRRGDINDISWMHTASNVSMWRAMENAFVNLTRGCPDLPSKGYGSYRPVQMGAALLEVEPDGRSLRFASLPPIAERTLAPR
eukprot:6823815-Pyramimonas_sp.AAC.1